MDKVISYIQNWFQKLTTVQKRRLALVCTGIFSFFLILSVVTPMINRHRERLEQQLLAEPERIPLNIRIPVNELFLPDEPDFVPGVLLGRDRRTYWTEEDASEFWQDPLRYGEAPWREMIERSIDEFLERVP